MSSIGRTRARTVPKSRPHGLPDFDRPPVTEVVLSIQFAILPAMRTVHAGIYWNLIRAQYPKVSEQPAIMSMFETFGGTPTLSSFRIQTFATPPMARHWFETDDGEHLVQL